MTVRLEKEVLLWVKGGKPCVMVDGPVIFSCDNDHEAATLKLCLEMLPEVLGFAAAMSDEALGFPAMVVEAWKFISSAAVRYELDDGSTLAQARSTITPALAAELEEMAGVKRVCRECGCTEDNACEGPCYWVELDLCSACSFRVTKIGQFSFTLSRSRPARTSPSNSVTPCDG